MVQCLKSERERGYGYVDNKERVVVDATDVGKAKQDSALFLI